MAEIPNSVPRIERTLTVPIRGSWVDFPVPLLHATFPMTPEQWDEMMRVLEAMKVGLVAAEETARHCESEET